MIAPATVIVLVITGVASLYAFLRPDIREQWIFNPQAILARKEFHRLFTCGLIHADWIHFAFNAFSFWCFARIIEVIYGAKTMLLIYGVSIVGGSVLSLIIHRRHEYRALGASGGVCGIIFASIFLLPGMKINLFMFPIGLPASLYAVLFLGGSFIAHRRGADNIGHDAHLGGAIVGLLAATAMYPHMIFAAPWMFAGVMCLSLLILWALIFDPFEILNVDFVRQRAPAGGERERRYQENSERNKKAAEMDALLDKVSREGMQSLSNSQRNKLQQLSRELYGEGERTDESSSRKNP